MDTSTKMGYIKQLKQRHSSLAWWAAINRDYPLGVVPISTASRILNVTPNRVRDLVKQKRIRSIEDMPGGSSHDRFIPIIDLIDAPFAMTRGRPGVFGPEKRFTEQKMYEKKCDPYHPANKQLKNK